MTSSRSTAMMAPIDFDGGEGYDVIRGSCANDVVHVLSRLPNLKSIEEIDGGGGNNDRIVATTGHDVLDFSKIKLTGIEQITLGAGNDWVRGSPAPTVLQVARAGMCSCSAPAAAMTPLPTSRSTAPAMAKMDAHRMATSSTCNSTTLTTTVTFVMRCINADAMW